MKKIITYHNKFDRLLGFIAAGTLFFMMVLIFLDVMLRYFFTRPITGTLELTGEYLMVIIVYFALSYTLKHKGHVRVDILENKISPLFDKIFQVMSNIFALAAFLTLGYFNYVQAMEFIALETTSRGLLNYPLAPALLIISLGIISFCIRLITETIMIFIDNEESELGI